MTNDSEYRIATDAEFEALNADSTYDLLIGPDGFKCLLTEPEDRIWYRDLRPVVAELNRLYRLSTTIEVGDAVRFNEDAPHVACLYYVTSIDGDEICIAGAKGSYPMEDVELVAKGIK